MSTRPVFGVHFFAWLRMARRRCRGGGVPAVVPGRLTGFHPGEPIGLGSLFLLLLLHISPQSAGAASMRSVSEKERRVEEQNARPSLQCEPACIPGQGICHENQCFCRAGFSGKRCELDVDRAERSADLDLTWAISGVSIALGLGAMVGALFSKCLMLTSCRPTAESDEYADAQQQEIWKRPLVTN